MSNIGSLSFTALQFVAIQLGMRLNILGTYGVKVTVIDYIVLFSSYDRQASEFIYQKSKLTICAFILITYRVKRDIPCRSVILSLPERPRNAWSGDF